MEKNKDKYACDVRSFVDYITLPVGNYKLGRQGQVVFESVQALRDYINGVHAPLLQRIAILELKNKGE